MTYLITSIAVNKDGRAFVRFKNLFKFGCVVAEAIEHKAGIEIGNYLYHEENDDPNLEKWVLIK